MKLRIGFRCGCTAYRAACDRCIGSQSEFAREQFLRARLAVHQHDDIGLRSADLESDAAAFDANRSRSGPAHPTLLAAKHKALAILGADDERALLQAGNKNHALSFLQQVLRNAFVGSGHNLGEHVGGIVQTLGCVTGGVQQAAACQKKRYVS